MAFTDVDLGNGTVVTFELDDEVAPLDFPDRGFAELEKMAQGANELASTFRKWVTPDEISLEVSVGLSGEVGWFFTKSKLDAVITVSLKWNNPVADQIDGARLTQVVDHDENDAFPIVADPWLGAELYGGGNHDFGCRRLYRHHDAVLSGRTTPTCLRHGSLTSHHQPRREFS